MNGVTKIESKKLLFVEGKDEVIVFSFLLKSIGISDVQVVDCGGKQSFKKLFPLVLKMSDFDLVVSYAVIQDADDDSGSTFQSIAATLKKVGHPVPSHTGGFAKLNGLNVGVYILPGAGSSGMLEDLYLMTLEGNPIIECVNEFIDSVKERCDTSGSNNMFKLSNNISKAKALGTFVATHRPFSQLGHAAVNGYWDFQHNSMQPLVSFLRQL